MFSFNAALFGSHYEVMLFLQLAQERRYKLKEEATYAKTPISQTTMLHLPRDKSLMLRFGYGTKMKFYCEF